MNNKNKNLENNFLKCSIRSNARNYILVEKKEKKDNK
jgi:hypothetical protein